MSSPVRTLGSWVRIPLEAWMFVWVYSVFVLSCVGSGLATGWSLVQGVLPTVYKCKITEPHNEEAKARYGLERHIRRRRYKLVIKNSCINSRSRYSDWLRAGRPRCRISSPGTSKILSSPVGPDRFWGPPSLLYAMGTGGYFPWG
jgi:hypothetical protein